MTVQELIDLLETAPDKNLPVFAYLGEDIDIEDPNWIDSMDLSMINRVDLNIRSIKEEDFFRLYGAQQ